MIGELESSTDKKVKHYNAKEYAVCSPSFSFYLCLQKPLVLPFHTAVS